MKEYKTTPDTCVGTQAEGTGLPVGTLMPDAHASDLEGKDVALSSLLAKGPALFVFYRGGGCPYCNFEIHALTKAYPDFQTRPGRRRDR